MQTRLSQAKDVLAQRSEAKRAPKANPVALDVKGLLDRKYPSSGNIVPVDPKVAAVASAGVSQSVGVSGKSTIEEVGCTVSAKNSPQPQSISVVGVGSSTTADVVLPQAAPSQKPLTQQPITETSVTSISVSTAPVSETSTKLSETSQPLPSVHTTNTVLPPTGLPVYPTNTSFNPISANLPIGFTTQLGNTQNITSAPPRLHRTITDTKRKKPTQWRTSMLEDTKGPIVEEPLSENDMEDEQEDDGGSQRDMGSDVEDDQYSQSDPLDGAVAALHMDVKQSGSVLLDCTKYLQSLGAVLSALQRSVASLDGDLRSVKADVSSIAAHLTRLRTPHGSH